MSGSGINSLFSDSSLLSSKVNTVSANTVSANSSILIKDSPASATTYSKLGGLVYNASLPSNFLLSNNTAYQPVTTLDLTGLSKGLDLINVNLNIVGTPLGTAGDATPAFFDYDVSIGIYRVSDNGISSRRVIDARRVTTNVANTAVGVMVTGSTIIDNSDGLYYYKILVSILGGNARMTTTNYGIMQYYGNGGEGGTTNAASGVKIVRLQA